MTDDMNKLNSKIPPSVRHITAIKNRDYADAAWQGIQDDRFEMSLECFNNQNTMREPDYIGITLSYPAGPKKTHILTRFFPINIGEAELTRQGAVLKTDLLSKIPSEE